jgi:transglutaminase-like putative cysteine protease
MKFGLVHRIMTDALAMLGLLSLLTGGELDPAMAIVTGVCMVLAVSIPERYQEHPRLRSFGVFASLTLLGVQLTRAVSGGDLLQLSVEFAAALQVIRVATRRGAAHDQQIILLALLHLVAGTVLGGGLAYGSSLVGFLVIAPGALVLSHLRREVEGNYRQGARDRTGLPVDVPRILRSRRVISRRFLLVTCSLSIPVFLFTAVLFLLFPRVGLSLLLLNHSRSARMIGFSTSVNLGGVGKLRTDPTIAMRVHLTEQTATPAARLALYLRGTSFDHYDGSTWTRTRPLPSTAPYENGSFVGLTENAWKSIELRSREPRPFGNGAARRPEEVLAPDMNIDLESINPPIIFLPSDAIGFRVNEPGEGLGARGPKILVAADDEYKYERADERGLQYGVYRGRASAEPLSLEDRKRYLEVPAAIARPLAELAKSWTGAIAVDWEEANAIEERLRSDYRYDLDSPSGAAPQPLLHFLFESKAGHCEFYSTAMAMLLRTLNVPTRNVTGFIGGTYNRFGEFYAVRQGDAHSWVEVYLEGKGWTRFDPTPPSSSAPRSEVSGMIAFLRDVIEAAAQRWSRHVIGYDLDQQIELFRSVKQRYRDYGGPDIGRRVRPYAPALTVLVVGGVCYLLWRRMRSRRSRVRPGKLVGQAAAVTRAVALYRSLEEALRSMGVGRQPTTPPLAHARALEQLDHPAAGEVLSLTERYLEARFGRRELSLEEERDFERRVKRLRRLELHEDRAA